MNYIEIPHPEIKIRKHNPAVKNEAMAAGFSPILADILARRVSLPDELAEVINPTLSKLKHPQSMQDLQLAAKRIAKGIINQEYIGIETDHDCDGQTSHAIIYTTLVKNFNYPQKLIKSYISHRLTEGYGLTEAVANRILADPSRVAVLITADNGSSDEPRIAKLKQHNIDVIITDHHAISLENYPYSAYAFINPTREDCQYDPYIAGCMVAWLLMVATRIELINVGYLDENAPKLLDPLDYVAVGTVADCVSLAKSHANRAVIKFGLKLINAAATRACWQACKNHLGNLKDFQSEDLAFKIAPLLNSDGRLADAFTAVKFLLAETLTEANDCLQQLLEQNKIRKSIQHDLTWQALNGAKQQFDQGKNSICVFLADGHPGVHGISASRIKDYFGRPTAIFAPKQGQPEVITGSLRGIDGFNIKLALQTIAGSKPDLLIAYGGHEGAGGAMLLRDNFAEFAALLEHATKAQLSGITGPIIWSDGLLPAEQINLALLADLQLLEPYGRGFDSPVFHNQAILHNIKLIGDGTHARVEIKIANKILRGVWFSMKSNKAAPCIFKPLDEVICVFKLIENNFNYVKTCELQIITMRKLSE